MSLKMIGVLAAAMVVVGSTSAQEANPPRPPGSTRTDLQRHDLGIKGREVLQARIDFAPDAAFPAHRQPGEEIIYVLEGTLEYQVEGKPLPDKLGRGTPEGQAWSG